MCCWQTVSGITIKTVNTLGISSARFRWLAGWVDFAPFVRVGQVLDQAGHLLCLLCLFLPLAFPDLLTFR